MRKHDDNWRKLRYIHYGFHRLSYDKKTKRNLTPHLLYWKTLTAVGVQVLHLLSTGPACLAWTKNAPTLDNRRVAGGKHGCWRISLMLNQMRHDNHQTFLIWIMHKIDKMYEQFRTPKVEKLDDAKSASSVRLTPRTGPQKTHLTKNPYRPKIPTTHQSWYRLVDVGVAIEGQ